MQDVLVYLQPFRRNSLLKSESLPKIAKNTNTSYFEGSWSFEIIDVGNFKKFVASTSYVKQHVCAYLQQFLR